MFNTVCKGLTESLQGFYKRIQRQNSVNIRLPQGSKADIITDRIAGGKEYEKHCADRIYGSREEYCGRGPAEKIWHGDCGNGCPDYKKRKMSIPEIFAQKGEAYFREKETALLAELQEKENVVISCGGGVPMRKENVEIMRRNSHVVWLCAKPETILERVRHSHDRPLLEGRKNMEYITELMEARREKYEAAADLRVAVDQKSAETIADEIIEKMKEK